MKVEQRFWNPVTKSEPQLSSEEKDIYLKLLLAAKEAKAFPRQSGYHVRAAVLTANGDIELGGNDEYAFSDAFVHGETSALGASLAKHGDIPITALAFYSLYTPSEGELVGGSCGNCRDVFREYVKPEMIVIEGDENFVAVTRWGDYLFENFRQIAVDAVDPRGIQEAQRGARVAVDVYLPEHLKHAVYGAAIVARSGKVWQGSLDTNAGYDAITPLVAARQVWRNADPEPELQKVVIAGYTMPDPLYRDRQTILDLDESLMEYTGRKTPLRVELVRLTPSGRIVEAAITNTKEWMPIPFTAGSFGMMEAVRGSVKGLFPNKDSFKPSAEETH